MTARPAARWTLLAILGSLCGACETFANVALVNLPDGSPEAAVVEGPADASASDDAPAPSDGGGVGALAAGFLTCGVSTCNLSSDVCCTCPNCALPFPTTCFPTFPGCVPGTVYSPLACGSSANCPEQISCCASFSSTGLTGASCRRACASTDVRLCASDAECAGETTCRALASIPGFMGCQ